jgi:hypothetical protein
LNRMPLLVSVQCHRPLATSGSTISIEGRPARFFRGAASSTFST